MVEPRVLVCAIHVQVPRVDLQSYQTDTYMYLCSSICTMKYWGNVQQNLYINILKALTNAYIVQKY